MGDFLFTNCVKRFKEFIRLELHDPYSNFTLNDERGGFVAKEEERKLIHALLKYGAKCFSSVHNNRSEAHLRTELEYRHQILTNYKSNFIL